jgi:hypothetical protein
MSQQYDRTNTGALFENDRKTTDKHPDLNGSININGVEHWLSGWWKEGSKGQFLSLSIGKPKDQQAAQPQRPAAPARQTPVRPGQRPAARQSSSFDDVPDFDEPPF